MKIQDYAKANCDLFRIPPVDFSFVERKIYDALRETWEQGGSASSALDRILSNGSIVGAIRSQIAPNMEYQKATLVSAIDYEASEKVRQLEELKKRRVSAVERDLGQLVESARHQYDSSNMDYLEKAGQYTAAQVRVNQMRREIDAKLARLGGVSVYQDVFKINEAVMSTQSGASPPSLADSALEPQYSKPVSVSQTYERFKAGTYSRREKVPAKEIKVDQGHSWWGWIRKILRR